ncbi:MAG TPA: N-6 DNA methylase [Pilimelia sp.]|nr:N-6 DNA methylase [Pilimelia sp.]
MTPDRSAAIGDATLTASGIARLANVGRAAVSNWRRRYADFPAPVGGTPTSPLFDARAVEEWLRRLGKLHQVGAEHRAWQHIESYQPAARIGDALGVAGAYLLTCHDRPPARNLPTPRALLGRLGALDRRLADLVGAVLPQQWTPQLTAVLGAADQLGRERDPEAAFEYLHGRYVTSAHALSGLAGTPDSVAEVMLALAGAGAHTFDFTSGTGSILRMAADRALRDGTVTRCHAQEIRPEYALIALLRLWFVHRRAQRAGHRAAPPDLRVGDSLLADAFPDLRADVVVANFPFGIHDWGHERLVYDPRWVYGLPPRTEPELAWVQHALAHLGPGGTAVVLMPPAAAVRPAGRRIRAELVRRGALRAVVALPAGLMAPTGIGLHVWVLGQPDPDQPPAGRVLVLDATAPPEGDPLPDVVGTAWRAYLAGRDAERPGVHRAVPAVEMLDHQVDLTPQRYLPRAGGCTPEPGQTLARITAFGRLVDDLRRGLPAVRQTGAAGTSTAPHAHLADLVRSGSVSVYRAVSRPRSTGPSPAGGPALTADDVLSGGPPTGVAVRTPDGASAPRVQAGDILVPLLGREITARVATPEQVGAALGPGVQLVRVQPDRFDPWFVAGVLSHTDNLRVAGRASQAGSGASRIDVRRLTIPVLPLSEQQAYGRAFRQLAEFRAALARVAAAGADLARDISDGLSAGTLTARPRRAP